jgi:replicative DNA helicase Mcm
LPDGTTVRGDIHILLIGDPGTAKSQILKYVAGVAPKSIYASGTSATGAGLTAAAVKDDFSGGQWSLEAGALVLADMGIACIDELDKMNDNDRNKLHTAMEQQEIPIAKAGINTSLPARTSMLAAANPKFGRFDLFADGGIAGQINLPPTLMSRFDLMFAITDVVNLRIDREKAHHVLKARQCPDTYEKIKPIFSGDFLRKYIAYTKQNVNPVLTNDAVNYLEDKYVESRDQGKAEGNITITVRQLESLIRLATASARIRLSKTIDIQDAEKAVNIYKEYIRRVGIDPETGKIDIDTIETGVTHSQHERMNIILDAISRLSEYIDDGATPKNVIAECEIKGIGSDKTESALERLERDKQISLIGGVYKING